MKLWKNFAFAVVLTALITSCSNYKFVTQSDIIYLEEGQDATSIFTNYKADVLRLQFKTLTPRLHYNQPHHYYWHTRPLWLDYTFIYDPWHFEYYSFFYRPWNYWDYWMRPWQWNSPWRDPMLNGPFNRPSYNIVYNNSRRKPRSLEAVITSNRIKPRVKPAVIIPKVKPRLSYKPVSIPSSNYKPSNNSYKPSNNYSKPSYNSRPSYNSNTLSKPSNNNQTKGNVSTTNRGIN